MIANDGNVDGALNGTAYIPDTHWAKSGVALRIARFPHATVSEINPGTVFPERCPERHIQYDRSFCLGLRPLSVANRDEAQQWWEQLRQFLICQSVAEHTRVWPPAHALDHGGAGQLHERALTIASQLGISEEYSAARLNEPSWITDRDLRLLDKNNDPINGRAPCPRGCRAKCGSSTLTGQPVLRRKCKHRKLLLELVAVERERRSALKKYWDAAEEAGTKCCGRMRSCELQRRAAITLQASDEGSDGGE